MSSKLVISIVGSVVAGSLIGAGGMLAYSEMKAKKVDDESCSIVSSSNTNNSVNTLSGKFFEYSGTSYTLSDLPADLSFTVYDTQLKSYQSLQNIAETYALDLFFQKQYQKKYTELSQNPTELAKIFDINVTVTDAEVKSWYDSNKDRIPPNLEYATIFPKLKELVSQEKVSKLLTPKLIELKNKTLADNKFHFLMTEPISPIANFNTENVSFRGDKNAKVVISVITDYLCGHCKHSNKDLMALAEKFDNKIRVNFYDFMLNEDPNGANVLFAKGAYCVKQLNPDKYFEYREKAFNIEFTDKETLVTISTKIDDISKSLGLITDKFKACMNNQETMTKLLATNKNLQNNGVNATPNYYINNKLKKVSLENFSDEIKKELNK